MKHIVYLLLLCGVPLASEAGLDVFACEPEWAALAAEIGGSEVTTTSATNALQDPHYIQARPSLIAKIRKADLLVCSGAELELGWLPMLLRKGNNPEVMPGRPGFFEASQYVERRDAAAGTDRSQGDVHPQGNPHVQTSPHNIQRVARALGQRMAQLDPASAGFYLSRLEAFEARWRRAITAWEERARPLRGKRVIVHHKSWVYLLDWLGLQEVATLEPVPGIAPTTAHLGRLLERFGSARNADFIIRAPFQNEKPSNWLWERTGIPAVMLPLTVGGSDAAQDLFTFFDDILDRLLAASGQREQ